MKTNTAINNIETNMTGQKNFSIKASAKAFKILSSGIYQNKIKAVIRELSCNAYDAHVAAGNQATPFDVHMPSHFEPWFSVRDYGTSMEDAKIKKLYTTYFDSTKDDSNEFIGALGIGSKSPFSYTDNYTVIAWSGTEKRIYTCYIGEDGTPSIVQMGKEKSDEKRGIEVRLAVKPEDFKQFTDEAYRVYYWFDVLPNGVTVPQTFKTVASNEVFPCVVAYSNKIFEGQEKLGVRMGQVYYPIKITPEMLDETYTITHGKYEVKKSFRYLRDHGLFTNDYLLFKVAIGGVDMTASREELEYTERTKACIAKHIKQFAQKSLSFLIDGVTNASSYNEARCVHGVNNILKDLKPALKWQTWPMYIDSKIFFQKHIVTYNLQSSKTSKPVHHNDVFATLCGAEVCLVVKDKTVSNVWERVELHKKQQLTSQTNNWVQKYNLYKDPQNYNNYYNNVIRYFYLDIPDERLLRSVIKTLDKTKIKYILSSQLPVLPAVVREVKEWEIDYYNVSGNNTTKYRKQVDPTKGGYYIINGDYTAAQFNSQINKYCYTFGLLNYHPVINEIYSVPKRVFDNVVSTPEWKDYSKVLPDLQQRFLKDCKTTFSEQLKEATTKVKLSGLFYNPDCFNFFAKKFPVIDAYKSSDRFGGHTDNIIQTYNALTGKNGYEEFVDKDLIERVLKYLKDNPITSLMFDIYISKNKKQEIIDQYLKGKI